MVVVVIMIIIIMIVRGLLRRRVLHCSFPSQSFSLFFLSGSGCIYCSGMKHGVGSLGSNNNMPLDYIIIFLHPRYLRSREYVEIESMDSMLLLEMFDLGLSSSWTLINGDT